ncbi:hypothetical protein MNV49_000714 [Pseudohyphozyma bogoriensis]|nr:hypothetical protein MNV49_000714 [Pseudohyphozyma bogoriensis]
MAFRPTTRVLQKTFVPSLLQVPSTTPIGPSHLLALYNEQLRVASSFNAYNFRHYFLRLANDRFTTELPSLLDEGSTFSIVKEARGEHCETALVSSEEGKERLRKWYDENVEDLAVMARSAVVNNMYETPKLVVETNVSPKETADDPPKIHPPRPPFDLKIPVYNMNELKRCLVAYDEEKNGKITLELKDDLIPPGEESELSAGEHSFPFSFNILPSTSDGSPILRRKFLSQGRHALHAHMELSPAPGKSVGSSKDRVVSPVKHVWIAALPGDPGDTPDPVNLSLEHFSEYLGPLRMSFYSAVLTAGAPALLKLHFAGPPSRLEILAIKTTIHQSFTSNHLDLPTTPSTKTPVTRISFSSSPSSSPLALPSENGWTDRKVLERGEEWSWKELVRIPDCQDVTMWPSSVGESEEVLTRHKLGVEVWYGVEGVRMQKVVRIEAPVVIASCICLMENILVPEYTRAPPKTRLKKIDYPGTVCMCDYSLEEIKPLLKRVMEDTPVRKVEEREEGVVPVKLRRVDSEALEARTSR